MKKVKRFLAGVLVAAMVCSSEGTRVMAASQTADEAMEKEVEIKTKEANINEIRALEADFKGFAGGDGTAENPYQVSDAVQLNAVRNNLNAYYLQVNDIDLSQYDNWIPIGYYENPFEGNYDGGNFCIKNLSITQGETYNIGLFGACHSDGKIQNVELVNMNFQYTTNFNVNSTFYPTCVNIGGIVGVTESIVENCKVNGSIEVHYTDEDYIFTGGIVGNGEATNCINYCNLKVQSNATGGRISCGGISGYAGGTITNCKNKGNIDVISSMWAYCGGISGEYGKIEYCINYGNINASILELNRDNSVPAIMALCSGGIVGRSFGEVYNSYNYGNVNSYSAEFITPCSGGIAGDIGSYSSGKISNCYSLGTIVEAKLGDDYQYAGRIAGTVSGYGQIFHDNYALRTMLVNNVLLNDDECSLDNKNGKSIDSEMVEDDAYGVSIYQQSAQEKVYDDAESFYKALNQYIEAFKSSAQTDTKSKGGGRSAMAKKLQEADAKTNDKIITPDPGATKESLQCVYETLADYLEEYTQEGIEIGKIDLKQNYITISAGIVNKIRNKMGSEALEFTRTFKNYTVTFYVARNFGTNFGRIEVTGIHPWIADGVIKSSAKDTAKILTDYVNDLSDTVKDLSKQALKSVLTDFTDKAAISDFTKEELNSIFKGKVDLLRNNGYGNILKNMIKLRDSYDVISTIISASKKGNDLKAILQDAKKIYDKIQKFDYSDSLVDKAALQSAMNMLERAKKKLGDSLFNYIYNIGNSEEEGVWNSIKKIFIQCPVDFTVYDSGNNVLGYVKDGSVYYDDKIRIEVSGDVKIIIIPSELAVRLSMEGTGDGKMNYVIEEVRDGKIVGRQNYYDIPLEQGKSYSQLISSDSLSTDARSFPITSSDGAMIYASEYIAASNQTAHILVSCGTETGGRVIGDGSYAKGSPVELLAFPADDTYEFSGWYIGNNLVGIGSVYRFTALENVNIRASFAKKTEQDSNYETILGEDYDEFAWVHIYKTGTDSKNVALRMLGLDVVDKCRTVTVKKYTELGRLINETSLKTDYDNVSTFWLNSMGLESAKTEIYDMSGKLIVAIYNNTDISPENLITNISLTMETADLKDGAAVQLAANIAPTDAVNKTLSWSSDNPSVATVNQNGLVTAVALGKATITVSSTDGSNVSASCVITVTKSGSVTQPGGDNNTGDNSSGGNSSGGSSSSGGSTGDIPSGDSISNNNSNSSGNKPDTSVQIKLLYYIVEFNANAGTKLSRKTMTLLNDDNLGILPKVQRKNYSFKGWYTQKSGGTKVNSDTVLNAGTTLFAQWQKVKKPSKVKVLSLKSSKKGRLVIRFQKAGKADGYEIFYSTDKKFPSSLTKKMVTVSDKKTLQKLKSGKNYYIRIRAYKLDSAGKKVYGKYSKVKTVRVK